MRDRTLSRFFHRSHIARMLCAMVCVMLVGRSASARTNGVIGGSTTAPGAYPWQALLKYQGIFQCGAVLVRPHWVLTAAHCVKAGSADADPANFQVVLGEYDRALQDSPARQIARVVDIVVHPDYATPCCYRDLALLRLSTDAPENAYVAPVAILTDTTAITPGLSGVVSGWGMTAVDGSVATVLQSATMTVTSDMRNFGYFLTAGPSAICYGDSGGPFVIQSALGTRLAGIASFGGCSPGGGFADVAGVAGWIEDTTQHDGVVIGGPAVFRLLLPLAQR